MDQQAKQEIIKEKRFSIIIPTYNVEKYIERCLKSITAQTFNSYEVIIVDTSSEDRTVEIANKYISNNIKLINRKDNAGPGGARNLGLDEAIGEYILFVDADDYLNNDEVLEKLNNIIGNNKPDVVYMGFQISGNREELVIPTPETCTKKYKAALDKYANVWSKCWRRDLIEKNNIRFQEGRYYEDILFLYKAVMKSENYLIADYPVHTYISGRENSITTTLNFKNVYDTINNIEEMVKMREKEPTEELDIIIEREINMCKKRLEMITNKNN